MSYFLVNYPGCESLCRVSVETGAVEDLARSDVPEHLMLPAADDTFAVGFDPGSREFLVWRHAGPWASENITKVRCDWPFAADLPDETAPVNATKNLGGGRFLFGFISDWAVQDVDRFAVLDCNAGRFVLHAALCGDDRNLQYAAAFRGGVAVCSGHSCRRTGHRRCDYGCGGSGSDQEIACYSPDGVCVLTLRFPDRCVMGLLQRGDGVLVCTVEEAGLSLLDLTGREVALAPRPSDDCLLPHNIRLVDGRLLVTWDRSDPDKGVVFALYALGAAAAPLVGSVRKPERDFDAFLGSRLHIVGADPEAAEALTYEEYDADLRLCRRAEGLDAAGRIQFRFDLVYAAGGTGDFTKVALRAD